MSVFRRMAAVRTAQAGAESARIQWHTAANGLFARGRAHPIAMLGAVAGIGLLLGGFKVRPWRVPGFGALIGGGVAEGITLVTRLIGELGLTGHTDSDDAPKD